jgi:hypothetical protein
MLLLRGPTVSMPNTCSTRALTKPLSTSLPSSVVLTLAPCITVWAFGPYFFCAASAIALKSAVRSEKVAATARPPIRRERGSYPSSANAGAGAQINMPRMAAAPRTGRTLCLPQCSAVGR